MPKTVNKTQANKASVKAFIDSVEDERKRKESKTLDKMLREISGEKPVMWGGSIIGYGRYEYSNVSGRGGVWPKIGFSPRKANLTLYVMPGFSDYDALLKKLGKHTTGKSCLYIKTLEDVDQAVLRKIAEKSWASMTKKYG